MHKHKSARELTHTHPNTGMQASTSTNMYIYIQIFVCKYYVNKLCSLIIISTHLHVHLLSIPLNPFFLSIFMLYPFPRRTGGRGGGLGSRPKKMYGERLGDGVEYHLMSPRPVVKYHLRRGVGLINFFENGTRPQPPTSPTSSSWKGIQHEDRKEKRIERNG